MARRIKSVLYKCAMGCMTGVFFLYTLACICIFCVSVCICICICILHFAVAVAVAFAARRRDRVRVSKIRIWTKKCEHPNQAWKMRIEWWGAEEGGE